MLCDCGLTSVEISPKDAQGTRALQMHHLAPALTGVLVVPVLHLQHAEQSICFPLWQGIKLLYPDPQCATEGSGSATAPGKVIVIYNAAKITCKKCATLRNIAL